MKNFIRFSFMFYKWLAIRLAVVFLVITLGWHLYLYNLRLSFVPEEMGVWRILFAKEESWGFGPGGNETGFIMYELPTDIAEKVSVGGIAYLSSLPSAKLGVSHGWRRKYDEWYETPVHHKLGIAFSFKDPECAYCIKIDPDIEVLFEQTVAASGSFFAYGRIGMIVVSPAIHKIFYFYQGT